MYVVWSIRRAHVITGRLIIRPWLLLRTHDIGQMTPHPTRDSIRAKIEMPTQNLKITNESKVAHSRCGGQHILKDVHSGVIFVDLSKWKLFAQKVNVH